jgi:putative membrane protein
LLASAIVLMEMLHPSNFTKVNATPFTLLGLSLSIFMSFRNNACYDRWYEARKAWGDVLVHIRSVIRETQVIRESAQRKPLLLNLCGFAHSLNARLRRERSGGQPCVDHPQHDAQVPDYSGRILQQVGQQCSDLHQSGELSEWRYMLANHLTSLTRRKRCANGSKTPRCPSPTPCCCTAPSTCSASCCRSPWPNRWAG